MRAEQWRHWRMVAMAVVCAWGAAAQAQTQGPMRGHISMAKEVYLAGEPVYVLFEFTNTGKDAVQYAAGDGYAEGCAEYAIEVSSGPALAHPSCREGGDARASAAAECITSTEVISGGETQHKLILVNYAHDLSRPGEYEIHATQTFRYAPLSATVNDAGQGKKTFKAEARFHIRTVKGSEEALKHVYQPYVNNLSSADDEIQREAERAIASGAPPWLEDTIVDMLRKYTSRELALLGLRNLNTPRAREELAKIVQSTSEYTQENEAAVGYLAQMGDKKYFPLLLELAKKQPTKEGKVYVLAAAELGGDDAVSYLRGLLSSEDPAARANGAAGLGQTGSREAVPLLIGALKDAEAGKSAFRGLTVLTHRSAFAENDPPAEEYGKWEAWWSGSGASAKVYGPRECGEVDAL